MGGIFGVISTKQCRNDLFYGVDYHSHLGTRRGGMAVYNGDGIFARDIHSLENSYFRVKFEDDLYKYTGNLGIGVISDTDAQPIVVNSHLGRFAIVTVGKICNIADLEKEMLSQNKNFTELSSGKTNPTELIAQIITCSPSFEEGIKYVQQKIKGSCTFVILTENCLIACRDLYGRTPLIIGKKDTEEDGQRVQAHAVASESCSFPNLGYKDEYILGPGEAVRMTADSLEQIVKPGKDMDTVCSIPDSGTCMAIGYSDGKGVPFRNGYVKYTPTWPRSFTPTSQDRRNLVAKMKLIPNGAILHNHRPVFCDDSIVRGTQLRNNVRNLYEYGAKEVHVRISCPPLVYPCEFINFSESRTPLELICRRFIQQKEGAHDRNLGKYVRNDTAEYAEMVEYIRKEVNVASLKFNTIDNLISSIGLPREMICTHCFDGSSYGHE